jgi:nucleoid-associated protein YgaU
MSAEVNPSQPEPVKVETTAPQTVETPKPVIPASPQSTTSSLKTNVVKETIADTLEYRITGLKATYTLKEGETLARVAANFYQNRRLWPYIAKYNKDILPNVNRVVPGMVIRVPELAPVE